MYSLNFLLKKLFNFLKLTMKIKNLFPQLLFCSLLFSGFVVNAVDYDYSYTSECLKNPKKPQYGGGIVKNPELKLDLNGWTSFGNAKIEKRVSASGNEFVVAHQRNQHYDSVSQEFYLDKEKLYTFSAWLQVSHGDAEEVGAIFKTRAGYQHAGWITAKSGCWSMLKGGIVANTSGPARLYFESKNASVELWVDSISLQPFTQEEWISHQEQSTEKVRKSKVKIQAVDAQGKPLANRRFNISQKYSSFPLGCAINNNILNNGAYQNWFTSRFRYTTFENEMKWYSNERNQNQEDYSTADAMLNFAKSHGISVRGHNVLWDDPRFQPEWVKSLQPDHLRLAAAKRINSVMRRYAGQVIAWDVVNENLHWNFFESKLGGKISTHYYTIAQSIDRGTNLFLNEYNTIEEAGERQANPDSYLKKIRQIQDGGFRGSLAVGLEGHFGNLNLAYTRSAIDMMASAGLPVWITELDVKPGPNQASFLEQVLREARTHPAINGIVIWAPWTQQGCWRMCLTDNNFNNLATGDVVDRIIREWSLPEGLSGTTDADGFYETSLFHGDYEVVLTDDHDHRLEGVKSSFAPQRFTVAPTDSSLEAAQHIKVISV